MAGPGHGHGGGPLAGALAAALRAASAGPGGCAVVTAPDDPLVATAPEQFVPVAGARVRVAVAAGLAVAGRQAVALAGGCVQAHLPAPAGLVAIVSGAAVAGAWWGAGWTLVQPAWPQDVEPLLHQSLASRGPVVLRVDGGGRQPPPEAGSLVAPVVLGVPRVLREGTVGLLAACGPERVRLLLDVTRMLAGRGVALQAVELHTAGPGEGPGPRVTDRGLLLGDAPLSAPPAHRPRVPGLRAVAVPDDPRGAMEAVAAELRAVR